MTIKKYITILILLATQATFTSASQTDSNLQQPVEKQNNNVKALKLIMQADDIMVKIKEAGAKIIAMKTLGLQKAISKLNITAPEDTLTALSKLAYETDPKDVNLVEAEKTIANGIKLLKELDVFNIKVASVQRDASSEEKTAASKDQTAVVIKSFSLTALLYWIHNSGLIQKDSGIDGFCVLFGVASAINSGWQLIKWCNV